MKMAQKMVVDCGRGESNPWTLSAGLLERPSPSYHFLARSARAPSSSMASTALLRIAVSCELRHPMERKISLWREDRIQKVILLPEGRRTSYNLRHPFAEVNGREHMEVPDANACDTAHENHERSVRDDGRRPVKTSRLNEIMQKLKRYGISGVLSYGLLNTVYYLLTFVLVWFFIAPAPGRMGYGAAVERFLKVLAMVWAGSQVTKLARAGGALALAPMVDKGLSWFTRKFEFESRGKAFLVIAGICFSLAFLLFIVLTALWA
ncbi:unnamed protein product [Victoria cruziana]